MKKLCFTILVSFFVHQLLAQSPGDYRSFTSGNWSIPANWEQYDGNNWVNPAPAAPNSSNNVITIKATHSISISSNTTINQVVIESNATLNLDNTAIISGAGTLTVNGIVNWNSGTLSTHLNVASNGTLNMLTNGDKIINSAKILTNNGTINWAAGNIALTSNGTAIDNFGTFTQTGNSIMTNGGGAIEFRNQPTGIYTKAAGTPTTTYTLPITNSGIFNLNSNTTHLNSTFNNIGTINVGNGATLQNNTTFIWGGTINFENAVFNVNGNMTLNTAQSVDVTETLNLNYPATISGTGTLTVNGIVNWNSATLSTHLNVASNGTLNMLTNGDKIINSAKILTNNGTINWAAGNMALTSAGTAIDNFGSFTQTGNNILTTGGGSVEFRNQSTGIFTKSSTGTTNLGIPIKNSGIIICNSGTLNVTTASFNLSGGTLKVLNTATLQFLASFSFLGTSVVELGNGTLFSNSELLLSNGTIFKGSGNCLLNTGSITNFGCTFSPGVSSTAILNVNGIQPLTANTTVAIDILDGSGAGTGHDQIQRAGSLTLAGTLTITETGTVPNGTYTIVQLSSGSISGNFSSVNLPPNYILTVNLTSVTVTKTCTIATPSISSSGATTFCYGGSVTLTSSALTNNTWSTGETTQSITVSNSGSYFVTYDEGNGCVGTSAPVTVTVNPIPMAPIITPGGPTTFCQGGTVVLTSSAASNNFWSNGQGTQSITVNSSGSFTVRRSSGGCLSLPSDPVLVTVNPLPAAPVISANGPVNFCHGGSVLLSSSVIEGNNWNSGEFTSQISVTQSGVYNTVVVDGNGCTSTVSNSITVSVSPIVSAGTISGPESLCPNSNAIFSSSGIPGGTWSSSNTNVALINPNTGAIITNSWGQTIISYTVSGACVNPSVASKMLQVIGAPPVVSGPINVCQYFNGSNPTSPITYTASSSGVSVFDWIVPPNVIIQSGQGTNALTVALLPQFFTQANKIIRVRSSSVCGLSAYTNITLKGQPPSTPGAIEIPSEDYCASFYSNSPVYFKIPKASGASAYVWEVAHGSLGFLPAFHPYGPGINDTIIAVTFPIAALNDDAEIRVWATNECGISMLPSRKRITLGAKYNTQSISGPTNICSYISPATTPAQFQFVEQQVSAAPHTYRWMIVVSGIDAAGAYENRVIHDNTNSSNSLQFTFPQMGISRGSVIVTRMIAGCNAYVTKSKNFSVLNPSAPSGIDIIPLSSCPRVYRYSVSSMPLNATSLEWSVPIGGIIISGQGTTSIVVEYPPFVINGQVTVRSINACKSSSVRRLIVKLPIAFCRNSTSKNYIQPEIKIEEKNSEEIMVDIFPNPTTTDFKLRVHTIDKNLIFIKIVDMQGRIIRNFGKVSNGTIQFGKDLLPGVYFAEVVQGEKKKTIRILKY